MDEEYDAIVLGTGLKECILSGLLSVEGYKVLHMDKNSYYGGESASLNLKQMYERYRPGEEPPSELGASRDYNVDLVPKFIMANGNLVKVLIHTDVTKYLEFKAVDGSFVLNKSRVEKVPATDWEALRSPLMGLFEKRRAAKFLGYCQQYNPDDSRTWRSWDLNKMTMYELYQQFGLDPMTIDFLGHAVALHRDDHYMVAPAKSTVMKIKLYYESMMRYEGLTSPYIYPLYGLGELPQAFARLSAVHGGTYMLDRPDLEVKYDENGTAIGVACGEELAKSKFVVGDPTYFRDRVIKTGKVVRAMCILNHPIPGTGDASSLQMILPQKQVGRRSDIYVFCCSATHNVAPKNTWLAFVSTTVETACPEDELNPGLSLLGHIKEKFVEIVDVFEPLDDGKTDKVFISKGYDATSHFETEIDDVLDIYERITGKPLDLNKEDLSKRQEA